MATKFALCMGVSDYSCWRTAGWDVADLPFAVKDAEDFSQLLTGSFGFAPENIGIQRDAWCNSANILHSLHDLFSNQAKPGDLVCVFFSGHGTRVQGLNGDGTRRTDLWYDAIVPYSGSLLTDFDMAELAKDIDTKAINLTFVLDTGQMGGLRPVVGAPQPVGVPISNDLMSALVQSGRSLVPFGLCLSDPSSLANVQSAALQDGSLVIKQADDRRTPDGAKGIVFTACAADQYEWQVPALQNSLLTSALKSLLSGGSAPGTCADLVTALRGNINDLMTQNVRTLVTYSQLSTTPQVCGPPGSMTEAFLANRSA